MISIEIISAIRLSFWQKSMFQANDSTTKVKQDGGEYEIFAQIRHAILTSELKIASFPFKTTTLPFPTSY